MKHATIFPYVNDNDFLAIIKMVLDTGENALLKAEKDTHRNVIDPFLMLFEMGSFHLDKESWLQNEKTRQAQKTLSNSIGWFHQKVIGAIADWDDLGKESIVDVVNDKCKIIAEIKNKYNTVKQSDLIGVYNALDGLVMPKMQKYKGYTAYYVEIIPKKPIRYNECFTPSDNKIGNYHSNANELIRKIDGASFYELVTGEENALEMLYDAIPIAIQKIRSDINFINVENAKKYFIHAYGES